MVTDMRKINFLSSALTGDLTIEEINNYVDHNVKVGWHCRSREDSIILDKEWGGCAHDETYRKLYGRDLEVVGLYGELVSVRIVPEKGKPLDNKTYVYHFKNLIWWSDQNYTGAWALLKEERAVRSALPFRFDYTFEV